MKSKRVISLLLSVLITLMSVVNIPLNLVMVNAAATETLANDDSVVVSDETIKEDEEANSEGIDVDSAEEANTDEAPIIEDEIAKESESIIDDIDSEDAEEEVIIETFAKDNARAAGDIAINATNFPDAVFRNCILDISVDANRDKILSVSEISNVTVLGIEGGSRLNRTGNIGNLKGIENFTNLEVLVCHDNVLKNVDLSKNKKLKTLSISFNYIVNLDISNNTELTSLTCINNELKSLDLTNNTKLTHLVCSYNSISILDVSNNPAVEWLECSENKITSLNLSANTKLTSVICSDNYLTNLNVTSCPQLDYLECDGNELKTLNTSNNPKLMALSCRDNAITSLNLSANKKLVQLACNNNALSVLEIPNDLNLEYFEFEGQLGMKLHGVTMKADNASGIDVAWKAVSGATEYELYRYCNRYRNWEKVTPANFTGISFKDTNVTLGETYMYKLYACQKTTTAKKYLTDPQTSNSCTPVVQVPSTVKAVISTASSIKISWNKVAQATGYEIYVATSKGGTYKSIGTTTSNTIKHLSLKVGTSYYYKVKAYVDVLTYEENIGTTIKNPTKTKRIYSADSTVVGRKQIIPKVSGFGLANSSSDSLRLTWSKVSNASGYEIYRATSLNGTYKKVGTVKGSTTLAFRDKKLPYKATYYYKVRAYRNVEGVKKNGAFSDILSKKVNMVKTVVTAKAKNSTSIVLTWKKVSGAQKYEIYRATSANGIYKKVATRTGLLCTNTKLAKNKTYYYKVKAVEVIGNKTYRSAYSAVKSAQTTK